VLKNRLPRRAGLRPALYQLEAMRPAARLRAAYRALTMLAVVI
jgi:hypothetical protein